MDCCDNAGGRIAFEIDGKKYKMRGAATVRPTNKEISSESNADGSIYNTVKAVPASADLTLSDDCGLNLDSVVGKCRINATIKLIDMNRTYLFTRATLGGRPELNTETGEITGLKLSSKFVQQIEG